MYILSAFNLNLDLIAPECLVPDISYTQKFYFIQTLPLSLFGFLFVLNFIFILYKFLILKREKKELWNHIGTFKSSGIIIMYFLYLYVSRIILDVFNCSPTIPPTYDANGKVMTYLSVQFEQCGKPGGLQERLIPVASVGLLFYTIGFPVCIAYVMFKHKVNIMVDQLLRAQEEGDNRFENPIAYETRKAYSRLYYQYKPDFYAWSLMILGRKFCIAVTSVMFTTNPAFQIAACLLILFIAYALQTRFNPFMCYDDYEQVIKDHLSSISWSPAHMKVHAMLLSVNAKNKTHKKTYRNSILNLSGKLDKSALFQAAGSWIFNYNTVEATMLFCGVIICLMGVMFQSQTVASGYDNGGKDIITGVILFMLVSSIFYLFSIFCVEIYLTFSQTKKKGLKRVLSKKVTFDEVKHNSATETNPMMLKARVSKQLNVEDFDEPPPAALWPLFKQTIQSHIDMIKSLNETVASLKKEQQTSVEFEMNPIRYIKREMKQVQRLNTIQEPN